jgi:hypothetical protein
MCLRLAFKLLIRFLQEPSELHFKSKKDQAKGLIVKRLNRIAEDCLNIAMNDNSNGEEEKGQREDYEVRVLAETVLALNLSFQGKYDEALIKIKELLRTLKPTEQAREREKLIEYQIWEILSRIYDLKASILSNEQLGDLLQFSISNRKQFFAVYHKPKPSG